MHFGGQLVADGVGGDPCPGAMGEGCGAVGVARFASDDDNPCGRNATELGPAATREVRSIDNDDIGEVAFGCPGEIGKGRARPRPAIVVACKELGDHLAQGRVSDGDDDNTSLTPKLRAVNDGHR